MPTKKGKKKLAEKRSLAKQKAEADEDFNLPSQERLSLLKRLQGSLGDVPPHFWAACHLCDLQRLESLVQSAEFDPIIVRVAAGQTYSMIKSCKLNTTGLIYNT